MRLADGVRHYLAEYPKWRKGLLFNAGPYSEQPYKYITIMEFLDLWVQKREQQQDPI